MDAGAPRLVVLARPGAAIGFRLAGVTVVEAPVGREAVAYDEALAAARKGVVAAEQEVLDAVPEPGRGRAPLPLVLPFALPHRWSEGAGGRAWVAALVRRAIGYHVKLEEGSS